MKARTMAVTTGFMLAGAISFACASGEPEYVDAEYGQACVEQATLIRVEDNKCPDDSGGGGSSGHAWYYMGKAHQAPPVGSKVSNGAGSFTKPGSGLVGKYPASGGFGGKVTSGGT